MEHFDQVNLMKEMRKTIVAQKQLIGALEGDMALLLDELRRLKARKVKKTVVGEVMGIRKHIDLSAASAQAWEEVGALTERIRVLEKEKAALELRMLGMAPKKGKAPVLQLVKKPVEKK